MEKKKEEKKTYIYLFFKLCVLNGGIYRTVVTIACVRVHGSQSRRRTSCFADGETRLKRGKKECRPLETFRLVDALIAPCASSSSSLSFL